MEYKEEVKEETIKKKNKLTWMEGNREGRKWKGKTIIIRMKKLVQGEWKLIRVRCPTERLLHYRDEDKRIADRVMIERGT
jgi:hypothetical protein